MITLQSSQITVGRDDELEIVHLPHGTSLQIKQPDGSGAWICFRQQDASKLRELARILESQFEEAPY